MHDVPGRKLRGDYLADVRSLRAGQHFECRGDRMHAMHTGQRCVRGCDVVHALPCWQVSERLVADVPNLWRWQLQPSGRRRRMHREPRRLCVED